MAETYRNIFGRRQGRGIRPFLLLPKVVAVCLYIGGLTAMLVVWLTGRYNALDPADPQRLWLVNIVGRLAVRLVVPALLCALAFGILLFLQHPRQFIRMRWLLVKLVSLAILIPSAHWSISSRLALLRQAAIHGQPAPHVATQLTWACAATLAVSIWIVVLGRLKPRLGQNWAKAYLPATPEGGQPAVR